MAAQVLVPVALFAMIFGIVYLAITSNHREKMAMIEAGFNPKDKNFGKDSQNSLRFALLAIFVAIGIFLGNLTGHYVDFFQSESLGIVFAFLFGGIGLFIAHRIEKKDIKEQEQL